MELREGKEHSQNDTPSFLAASIDNAKRITEAKLLVRMDSGFDSLDNIKTCVEKESEYIIKRNLRRESKEVWLMTAEKHGSYTQERPGKEVYIGEICIDKGLKKPLRIVFPEFVSCSPFFAKEALRIA